MKTGETVVVASKEGFGENQPSLPKSQIRVFKRTRFTRNRLNTFHNALSIAGGNESHTVDS